MDTELINDQIYIKEKVTINLVWANIFGIIVFIVALIVFSVPFFILSHYNKINPILGNLKYESLKLFYINIAFLAIIFIVGIILHEVIHGIFFIIYSKNKIKSIKFGILPKEKLFTPYCHCEEILKINHYRIAAIMPLVILGIIPAGISLIVGSYQLLFLGSLFICAGAGDLLMVVKIYKEKKNTLIFDLPDDAGFIIYRPENK
jgi:hypothetical protein